MRVNPLLDVKRLQAFDSKVRSDEAQESPEMKAVLLERCWCAIGVAPGKIDVEKLRDGVLRRWLSAPTAGHMIVVTLPSLMFVTTEINLLAIDLNVPTFRLFPKPRLLLECCVGPYIGRFRG